MFVQVNALPRSKAIEDRARLAHSTRNTPTCIVFGMTDSTATPKLTITWFDDGNAMATVERPDSPTTHLDLPNQISNATGVADLMTRVAEALGADTEQHNEHYRPAGRTHGQRRANLPQAALEFPHSQRRGGE